MTNVYIIATLIVLAVFIISLFLKRILKRISHLASRTKTQLDDILLNQLSSPIRILVIFIGLYLAVKIVAPGATIFSLPVERIFTIVWILNAAFFGSRITNALFSWYTEELQHKFHRKIDNTIFKFIKKIINILILVGALLVILDAFGIEITPMLAGLGIGGLAVALALKPTLENFFSAIYITADRPMRIGDFVEIDDKTSGIVTDIGWRTTRIKTWDNNHLIIPNSKISNTILRNHSAPHAAQLFAVALGVSYDTDLEKAEKIIIQVAKKVLNKVEGGDSKFEPVVRCNEFGDSSINLAAILKVKDRSAKFLARHEFIKAIHARFKKEGIEIPFPQREVRTKK